MALRPAIRNLLLAVRLGDEALGTADLELAGWDELLPLIRHEQVGPWLWHRLRLQRPSDGAPSGFLRELRTLGMTQAAQNLRIRAVTAQVVAWLCAHGIRPILLKGVACDAVADRYPFFRHRQMADADLLVEPGQADRAWALLNEAGFRPARAGPSLHADHHHLPTLVSAAQVPVELHTSSSFFWSSEESWQRVSATARPVSWHGVDVLVPAPTEMLLHAVVHSLGDAAQGTRLRRFLTAAALIANDADIQWDAIAERVSGGRLCEHDSRHPIFPRAIRHWLAVSAWFAGQELPGALGDVRFEVELDLGRLLEFRLRHLAAPPRSIRGQEFVDHWMDEAARAQLSLGLGRLAHWEPAWRRPRRLASSAVLRLLYRMIG